MGCLDSSGRLRLSGRKKEMYITGGYNVYPAEVEAYLETHEGIACAASIGMPDDVMGEIGWAFVMPSRSHQLTAEELHAFCRAGLARYKVPDRFIIRPKLPMTALGKIDKQALRVEIKEMKS